jgi:putative aldouronate transport system permease protein
VGRKSRIQAVARRTWRERELWLISIPMLIWAGIFCYYPIYGVIVAFYNYIPGRPILQNRWVGLQYFQEFFTNPEFGMVMRNTLAISCLNILFAFPAPIVLAVLINELRNGWFKRVTQTVSYMPHFVSWVVTASLLFTLLGNEGLINELLRSVGLTRQAVPFLTRGQYFWGIITVANIWKGVGWASIIYLSAIAGIDEELYQAGAVDGLGRFGMIWHITLPGILTTVVVLFILDIGGIRTAAVDWQRPDAELLRGHRYVRVSLRHPARPVLVRDRHRVDEITRRPGPRPCDEPRVPQAAGDLHPVGGAWRRCTRNT